MFQFSLKRRELKLFISFLLNEFHVASCSNRHIQAY